MSREILTAMFWIMALHSGILQLHTGATFVKFERNVHRTFSFDIPQMPRTGHRSFTVVSMTCDKTVVTDCVIQM